MPLLTPSHPENTYSLSKLVLTFLNIVSYFCKDLGCPPILIRRLILHPRCQQKG